MRQRRRAEPLLARMFVLQLSPIWLCFLACYALFRGMASRNLISGDRRVSWAFTVLLTGFLFVAVAEAASARRLAPGTVLPLWLAADAALLATAAGVWFYRPWLRPAHYVKPGKTAEPRSRWNAAMLALVSVVVPSGVIVACSKAVRAIFPFLRERITRFDESLKCQLAERIPANNDALRVLDKLESILTIEIM